MAFPIGQRQRILLDWYKRKRNLVPEPFRLRFVHVLGELSEALLCSEPPSNQDALIGEVGIVYLLISSAAAPESFVTWPLTSDDPVTPANASAMMAKVLDCAREDFPHIRFFRVVRCLAVACHKKPEEILTSFERAIDLIIRQSEIPPNLG